MTTLTRMPKKPTNSSRPKKDVADRHKPRRMVGIPTRVAAILQKQAELRLTRLSDEVKRILIEHLQREGLWPSSDKD